MVSRSVSSVFGSSCFTVSVVCSSTPRGLADLVAQYRARGWVTCSPARITGMGYAQDIRRPGLFDNNARMVIYE